MPPFNPFVPPWLQGDDAGYGGFGMNEPTPAPTSPDVPRLSGVGATGRRGKGKGRGRGQGQSAGAGPLPMTPPTAVAPPPPAPDPMISSGGGRGGRGGGGGGGGRRPGRGGGGNQPPPAPGETTDELEKYEPDAWLRMHLADRGLTPGGGANVFDDWLASDDLYGDLDRRWREHVLRGPADGGPGGPTPMGEVIGAENAQSHQRRRDRRRDRRHGGRDDNDAPDTTGPGTGYTFPDYLRQEWNDPDQFREMFYSMDPSRRGEGSSRYVGAGRTIQY